MTEITLTPKDWLEAPDVIVNEISSVEDGDIVIDAADCASIGAEAAQILLAAQNSAKKRGAKLTLTNLSTALRQELDLIGLSEQLAAGEG